MFVRDRDSSRKIFVNVWKKYKGKSLLDPMEQQILNVILEHPEYHHFLDDEEKAITFEVSPESGEGNPFLHMGMHIAIKEQIQFDQPSGIREICQTILEKHGQDQHNLEHRIMACFGRVLWEAQMNNKIPDEAEYLACVKRLK